MKSKANYMIVEANFGEETHTSNKISAIGGGDKFYFEELFNMIDFKTLEKYSDLERFVDLMIDLSEEVFGQGFDSIAITLIDGADDTFIWGIDANLEKKNFSYSLLDWRKDGNRFKYIEE